MLKSTQDEQTKLIIDLKDLESSITKRKNDHELNQAKKTYEIDE